MNHNTLLKNQAKRLALMILDGWGIGAKDHTDAIYQASTPYYDHLLNTYPHNRLVTYGNAVGLPDGQMGNSEVGHLNIGAGRVVFQELLKINRAIADQSFFDNKILLESIQYAQDHNKPVHLIGLLSDGGVHSHTRHLKAIIQMMDQAGVTTYIHAFTDGRDVDPHSGIDYIKDIITFTAHTTANLASVIGRYYAMDRDKRWERIKQAYTLLVKGTGIKTRNVLAAIQEQYDAGLSDEFLKPISLRKKNGKALCKIKNEDVVIFFNFRTDRPRQLTEVLSQSDLPDHHMKSLDLHFITMTPYDHFKNVKTIFTKEHLSNTLGSIIEKNNLTQLRIAETEKYAHVTYFFNGGREKKFNGEERILVPSPKVATYDLKPEMSAHAVTDQTIIHTQLHQPHFICLNYANTDMVGHTGVFNAAKRAASTVDDCLSRLIPHLLKLQYEIIIIADHGNSDLMINPDGSPHTSHTTNPVPIIFVSDPISDDYVRPGALCDIAPTILDRMNLNTPKEMTGNLLIQKK